MYNKGQLPMGEAISTPFALLFLVLIIVVNAFVFGAAVITDEVEQSITSLSNIDSNLEIAFQYLNSEVNYQGNSIVMSDLIKIHCNNRGIDGEVFNKIIKNTDFTNLPFPSVLSFSCVGEEKLLRGPICERPKTILIPHGGGQKIRVMYCPRPDSSQFIETSNQKYFDSTSKVRWSYKLDNVLDIEWYAYVVDSFELPPSLTKWIKDRGKSTFKESELREFFYGKDIIGKEIVEQEEDAGIGEDLLG